MERLRDFAIARLRVNGRGGEPLWDRLRATPGPESLEYKLALFESRGRTALLDEEVFPEGSWVAMLTGLGAWPRRYDFRVDALDPGQLENQLRRMRATIAQAAQAMPQHAEYLRRCGAAAQGAGAEGAGA
jgi:tryptophan halogenase